MPCPVLNKLNSNTNYFSRSIERYQDYITVTSMGESLVKGISMTQSHPNEPREPFQTPDIFAVGISDMDVSPPTHPPFQRMGSGHPNPKSTWGARCYRFPQRRQRRGRMRRSEPGMLRDILSTYPLRRESSEAIGSWWPCPARNGTRWRIYTVYGPTPT